MERLRLPAVAGAFYSADPDSLQRQINRFLANAATPEIKGEIKALIAPHAGYAYSGQVAAFAYNTVKGKDYAAVIVIAPSHYMRFDGASIYHGAGYQLPTGVVSIHQELSQRIEQKSNLFGFFFKAHEREHSLEVQLPFLQTVLPETRLVPIVQSNQDLASCRQLAQAIAQGAEGQKVLLVASSDLSHYHPYARAVELDKVVQDYVSKFDPEGLASAINRGACEACGAGPIITVMLAARQMGADKAKVLKYANSGDVSREKTQVVGYMAAAFYDSSKSQSNTKADTSKHASKIGVDMGLDAAEKSLLHRIARTTIECGVQGKPVPDFEINSPVLREKRGAFVTINKQGHLRGCIGYIQAIKPLHQTIKEMASSAAFNDPRFPPVTAEELPSLELEISVLTPLRQLQDIKEIEIGKHGLYIQQGVMSGLLLPQVATEYNWDRITFLQQTCRKAGLPSDAWQDKNTKIYLFSADIF